ncbi:MAG: AhpC/TSA family protein [Chromatiales bacterium]|nr:AhpC/TSA family protein [Chromatiales bacterium]
MNHRFLLLTAALAAISPCLAQAATSYAEQLEAQQTALEVAGQPPVSKEDQVVMDRARDELARLMPSPGLRVGEIAPDFTLPNSRLAFVRLYDLLRKGPVILTFYRGAWCPYCNLQLKVLNESLPEFEKYGASLVAVTPQTPDQSIEQFARAGYPFEVLSDLSSIVMQQYRLHYIVPPELRELYLRSFQLDLASYNGPDRYELPVPGTFVIDQAGRVRAAFADVDYRRRAEPVDIIAALEIIKITSAR